MSNSINSTSNPDQTEADAAQQLSGNNDMPRTMELVEAIRLCSEEDRRFVFRELAKEFLDPNAEELAMLRDNQGNILGYFESSLFHLRSHAAKFPENNAESKEDFMKGSLTLGEFFERVTTRRESDEG